MFLFCMILLRLEITGTGYLVGTSMTLADVGFYECLLAVIDYFGHQELNKYGKQMLDVNIYVLSKNGSIIHSAIKNI